MQGRETHLTGRFGEHEFRVHCQGIIDCSDKTMNQISRHTLVYFAISGATRDRRERERERVGGEGDKERDRYIFAPSGQLNHDI